MTNSQELKDKLGEYTEKVEEQIGGIAFIGHSYYSELEPYQRGLILMALTVFLVWIIYYLTKKETPEPRELTDQERKKIEALAEERILKRAEFLSRLRK